MLTLEDSATISTAWQMIAGSGFVRIEREYQQKHSLSNGHVTETFDPETENHFSAEASIKSTMQLFIKFSAGIILDSWNESNRSHLVAKLIFLDQLCELSPYLPRSLLESHVPYAILRSVYSQYYSNFSTPLALLSSSPRHSPATSLVHASPALKLPHGDFTHGQDQYDTENGFMSTDNKHRNVRRSGPLDYSLSRKTKFVECSTSSSTGPSPLPRFAVSRSGPISYK
ncbi:Hypothetical predicted protein [Olea europaea subsp. europaea]|uniref:Uncharacterized protein n=1 Tax=Olea europaea subsp. europaea TaxID=158383 RepID=A0A8S0U2S1_OLEEU|nr:Hypothetical predicted protein [Olea europaea subsp. europaea]